MPHAFHPGDRVAFVGKFTTPGEATVVLVIGEHYIVQRDDGTIVQAFYWEHELSLLPRTCGGTIAKHYGNYAAYILGNIHRIRVDGFEPVCFEEWLESEVYAAEDEPAPSDDAEYGEE